MDWLEILKIHKGLDLFFNVSIPAGIAKQKTFGHVLLVCPDDEIRQHFASELVDALQPLALEKASNNSSLISATEPVEPFIGFRSVRWDTTTTPSEMAAALTNLEPRDALVLSKGDVAFPDEGIDLLRTALSTYGIDIVVGRGTSANTIRLDLPEFTFVVCTSQESESLQMLESNFAYVIRITKDELAEICEKAILLTAMEEGCSFTDEACLYIVNCSGNDCRSAINYANRVIEYMRHYHAIGTQITEEHAKSVLGRLGIAVTQAPPRASDDVSLLLRDIQKKLSHLTAEVTAIRSTLSAIQGEEHEHSLTDIANALDRIEESMY